MNKYTHQRDKSYFFVNFMRCVVICKLKANEIHL